MLEIRKTIKQRVPSNHLKQVLRLLAEQAFCKDRPLQQREVEAIIQEVGNRI